MKGICVVYIPDDGFDMIPSLFNNPAVLNPVNYRVVDVRGFSRNIFSPCESFYSRIHGAGAEGLEQARSRYMDALRDLFGQDFIGGIAFHMANATEQDVAVVTGVSEIPDFEAIVSLCEQTGTPLQLIRIATPEGRTSPFRGRKGLKFDAVIELRDKEETECLKELRSRIAPFWESLPGVETRYGAVDAGNHIRWI